MESKKTDITFVLLVGLMIVATIIAYFPAIMGGYVWDDDLHLTGNILVTHPDGLRSIWFNLKAFPQYYPLLLTIFWIEHSFWGLDPFGYHLVNVLLHCVNGVLVLFILRRLRIPGALFAAAVFALHPVHVESVAWVSELKNVLSGFFYLLSLLAYLKFDNQFNNSQYSSPDHFTTSQTFNKLSFLYYILALLFFICALLSKTVTSTLPVVILLLYWWKKNRLSWQDIVLTVPFFALGLLSGLTTIWLEKFNAGAQGVEWSFSILERCLIAARALWFYAGKLIWPFNLVFNYPRWHIDAGQWWQYIFVVAALLVFAALWWGRHKIGRGPLVGVLCFFFTVFPALGFFDVYPMQFSFVADHFQYLASIGLITVFCAFCTVTFNRYLPGHTVLRLTVLGLLFIPLTVQVWQQGKIYQNEETIWRDTISKNENSWLALYNLGVLLVFEQKKYTEAIDLFEKTIAIKTDHTGAKIDLANTYIIIGNPSKAINLYQNILLADKTHEKANNNLIIAYLQSAKFQEALQHYTVSTELGVTIDSKITKELQKYRGMTQNPKVEGLPSGGN